VSATDQISATQRRAQELAAVESTPLWTLLTSEEQYLVSEPSLHPDLPKDVRYPLTIGQLIKLTGATERQIRHWDELGLLPTRRRPSGHRLFYKAAAIRAFIYKRMPARHLTTLRDARRGQAAPFLAAMATLWHDLEPGRKLELGSDS
jgi:hypothetical protein